MLNYFKAMMLMSLVLFSLHAQASPSDKSIRALNILNQWNDDMGKNGLLLHDMKFDKKFTEFENINTWFDIDTMPDERDIFFRFASSEDGAVYYLWFYPELTGEPPVVTIDLSDDSADNVTENIQDFVCSLIKGKSLSGENIYNLKSDRYSEVHKNKKALLKDLNCAKKIKVFFDLNKHPRFDEWLDLLDTKYQK